MLEYWWGTILNRNTFFEDETPKTIFTQIDIHNKLHITQSDSKDSEEVGSYIDDI